MKPRKDMKKELKLYQDEVYALNHYGQLQKIQINSLDDYSHFLAELHHFIPYNIYVGNEKWFEDRGIKQKLILVSKILHEQIEQRAIKNLSDEEFIKKYKISRWQLVFSKKHSTY